MIASYINPLNAELNPICHLLALLGGATIVVVSRLRVKHLPISGKQRSALHYKIFDVETREYCIGLIIVTYESKVQHVPLRRERLYVLCKFLLGKNSPKLQLFPGFEILYLSD